MAGDDDSAAERRPILVVEDEEAIRKGVCDVLAYHGYAPRGVERGDEGLEAALQPDVALVVLDIMLPGLSGFDVCERLRAARPQVPVLMLTARGSEEDVLRGFRAGADDYVTKPFSVAELVARVEALLRRAGHSAGEATEEAPFAIGGWSVDPGELHASCGSETVALSRREVDLLALLAREAGRIVSRRRLLGEVWGWANPERVETRTVDMQIMKLRRKLGAGPGAPIETVRGEGYRAAR